MDLVQQLWRKSSHKGKDPMVLKTMCEGCCNMTTWIVYKFLWVPNLFSLEPYSSVEWRPLPLPPTQNKGTLPPTFWMVLIAHFSQGCSNRVDRAGFSINQLCPKKWRSTASRLTLETKQWKERLVVVHCPELCKQFHQTINILSL